MSARHANFKDAKLYIQDILHRLARSQLLGVTNNNVGKWFPIQLVFDYSSNQVGFDHVRHLHGSVFFVTNRYLTSLLNIDDIGSCSYLELMLKAEEHWTSLYHPEDISPSSSTVCPTCKNTPSVDVGSQKRPSTVLVDITNCQNNNRKRAKNDCNHSPTSTLGSSNDSTSQKTLKSFQFRFLFSEYLSLKGKKKEILEKRVKIMAHLYQRVHIKKTITLDKESKIFYYRHKFSVIGKCLSNCFSGNEMRLVSSLPTKKGLYNYSCFTCDSSQSP